MQNFLKNVCFHARSINYEWCIKSLLVLPQSKISYKLSASFFISYGSNSEQCTSEERKWKQNANFPSKFVQFLTCSSNERIHPERTVHNRLPKMTSFLARHTIYCNIVTLVMLIADTFFLYYDCVFTEFGPLCAALLLPPSQWENSYIFVANSSIFEVLIANRLVVILADVNAFYVPMNDSIAAFLFFS